MELTANEIKALKVFAGKDPIGRAYLHAITVVANDDGGAIACASDGHRALLLYKEDAGLPAGRYCIPLKYVGGKLRGREAAVQITYLDRLYVAYDGVTAPLEGAPTAPDLLRIVPEKVSGELAQFDPNYVGDVAKVQKLLKAKRAAIAHNGDGPALLDFGRPNAFGLLMPLKCELNDSAPAWARQ